MHACRSVSAACRPAQSRRRRGEIGGIPWVNSFGSYTTQWSSEGYSTRSTKQLYNPLTTAAVSKPLELIGSPTYVLACQEPTAPDSDINQTAGSSGRPNMWKNRCMHAAVCLLHAGQLNRAGDVAKSGEFLGEFFWVVYDPMVVRGLNPRG